MSNAIIVGAQWGDEGKGKIVDYLTQSADIIVRAQGGCNAGHTVIAEGAQYVLHLIPSGILWPGKVCVIGNGVALDPLSLVEEFEGLEAKGIAVRPNNLLISDRAHLTMPYHRQLDALKEARLGAKKIGTTRRGIGPTYSDKVQRTGFRMVDLIRPEHFAQQLRDKVREANHLFSEVGLESLDAEEMLASLLPAAERLRPHMANTIAYLNEAIAGGQNLLFEGAQGTYLDIDYGTYPFVTSSNTTAGGACTGSGVAPHRIDKVVGVCKAYTTRVGSGPFPTEDQALSDHLHGMGREFGATTGRERRCGWLDLVLLRQAVMVNGIDELAVTNLDGLDQIDSLNICTHYLIDGEKTELPPASADAFETAQPVYQSETGWKQDLSRITAWRDLPSAARAYLDFVEEALGTRISMVGVGPDRAQTILRG